jgi:hypothetical protein
MKIFYGHSEGRSDVSQEAPVETTLDTALAVLRGLVPARGFMGVDLTPPFCLQLLSCRGNVVRIELLDTSRPALDACDVSADFAERLLHAAFDRRDVFQVARQSEYVWEHLDMAG